MTQLSDGARVPDRESLRTFVQGTLGCQCPAEVFRHVEGPTPVCIGNVSPVHRLLIGERLLIYLLKVPTPTQLVVLLPPVTAHGIAQRNTNGWNRLRIVVATSNPEALAAPAIQLFRRLPDRDDRVHLHVVDRGAVAALYDERCV